MSPMNNRRMAPMAEPGVLDFAPGAAAAYSLRNLSLSYSGPVVTVRRSTDDAEADLTAAEVSDGTLAAWCGGGDGFVKTWHDQTGIRSLSQTTAAAQPQIVDAGSLITPADKPVVRFNGTTHYMEAARITDLQGEFILCGHTSSSLSSDFRVTQAGPAGGNHFWQSASVDGGIASVAVFTGGVATSVVNGAMPANSQFSWSFRSNASLFAMTVDGAEQTLTVTAGTNDGKWIGNYGGLFNVGSLARVGNRTYYAGDYSELLYYPQPQDAVRSRIIGNQMWYY